MSVVFSRHWEAPMTTEFTEHCGELLTESGGGCLSSSSSTSLVVSTILASHSLSRAQAVAVCICSPMQVRSSCGMPRHTCPGCVSVSAKRSGGRGLTPYTTMPSSPGQFHGFPLRKRRLLAHKESVTYKWWSVCFSVVRFFFLKCVVSPTHIVYTESHSATSLAVITQGLCHHGRQAFAMQPRHINSPGH